MHNILQIPKNISSQSIGSIVIKVQFASSAVYYVYWSRFLRAEKAYCPKHVLSGSHVLRDFTLPFHVAPYKSLDKNDA